MSAGIQPGDTHDEELRQRSTDLSSKVSNRPRGIRGKTRLQGAVSSDLEPGQPESELEKPGPFVAGQKPDIEAQRSSNVSSPGRGKHSRLLPLNNQEQDPVSGARTADVEVETLAKPPISFSRTSEPMTPVPGNLSFSDLLAANSAVEPQKNPVTPPPVVSTFWNPMNRQGGGPQSQAESDLTNQKPQNMQGLGGLNNSASLNGITNTPTSSLPNGKTTGILAKLPGGNSGIFIPTSTNATSQLPETGRATRVLSVSGITGSLPPLNADAGETGSMTLANPMKVVQMPVAGQPGRYVTGFLPVLPQEAPAEPTRATRLTGHLKKRYHGLSTLQKRIGGTFAAVDVLGLLGSIFVANQTQTLSNQKPVVQSQNNPKTIITQSSASNIILEDPLKANIHNWLVSNNGSTLAHFQNGAYHLTNNDADRSSPSVLPDLPDDVTSNPLAYSVTMQQIKGDEGTADNAFGVIMRFNQTKKGGDTKTRFYSFEVSNTKDGEYHFWKYDDSQLDENNSPWKSLWKHQSGKEFHQGKGSKKVNTFKVFADGKNFTLYVNNQKVGTVQDDSFKSGTVGMLVALKDSEVAFSDLRLTKN